MPDRKVRLRGWMDMWFDEIDTDAGDMVRAESEVGNIARLRRTLGSTGTINAATYDEIFDALTGAHAFNDRFRFVAGGLKGLRVVFLQQNGLDSIKAIRDLRDTPATRGELIATLRTERAIVDDSLGSKNNWQSIFLGGLLDDDVADWLFASLNQVGRGPNEPLMEV